MKNRMQRRIPTAVAAAALFIILIIGGVYTASSRAGFFVSGRSVSDAHTVLVDAGHGGEDGGSIGIDGTVEKVINLQIAKKVQAYLQLYGFRVIMTRTSDDAIYDSDAHTIRQKKVSDIHNREKLMLENPDAVFVSIHQNHFSSASVHGTQVFYSGNHPSGQRLAECLQTSIVKNTQENNTKQVKLSGTEIYLLYHAKIPAVMVECGFLSNAQDLRLLKDDAYQKSIAVSVADGLIQYFNESDDMNVTEK